MKINVFFVSSISLTISLFPLIIILLRHCKDKIQKICILFNISVLWWAIGATLVSISNNEYMANAFWRFGCIGVTFIPVFLLHLIYCLMKLKINRILLFAYTQAFIFFYFLIFTNLVLTGSYNKYFTPFYVPAIGKLYYSWFIFWSLIAVYSHYYLFKHSRKYYSKDQFWLRNIYLIFALGFASGSINFLHSINLYYFQYANFGIVIYTLFLTYAILKHQMLGIEIVYRKGLLYSILIAVFTGVYLLIIFIAEWFFRGILGYKSFLISLTSAFILAILFNPLRNMLQFWLDKLFLGKTFEEYARENDLLKQELERSERLKAASTLALGLAHEIRNPLTTIKTFAEFLPEKYADKDFINKFSKLIPTEVERINNIIHQLLTFSKPSPPSFKDTDIHGLIRDILGFLNSEFLKKKIKISEEYADSTLIIRIDPIQIKQALLNIVFNAIDALPNGGMLSMKTEIIKDSCFKIRITDTGCGILKEDLKHIFDPFYSKKDEGTGLGLAITHRIITNHGGTIEADSEIGKGATFIIMIPLTTKISEMSGE